MINLVYSKCVDAVRKRAEVGEGAARDTDSRGLRIAVYPIRAKEEKEAEGWCPFYERKYTKKRKPVPTISGYATNEPVGPCRRKVAERLMCPVSPSSIFRGWSEELSLAARWLCMATRAYRYIYKKYLQKATLQAFNAYVHVVLFFVLLTCHTPRYLSTWQVRRRRIQ